jgi:uncharacterized protein YqjF (DUF2071 family)
VSRLDRPFLTAEWRHLAMLNFEIDPAVLRPFVPMGTQLDSWHGRTFVSVVGFLFLNTRVWGCPIPYHRNFEEVNLRFYVRRREAEGWRRGVVFIKEIVPRVAIALTARLLYGENYVALRMQHRIERPPNAATVSYGWWLGGREHRIDLHAAGEARDVKDGSEEEFITEHYWGYARRAGAQTTEYRVEHPRWRVRLATSARLESDVATLYGAQFVEFLKVSPASALLADGSEVAVFKGRRLTV